MIEILKNSIRTSRHREVLYVCLPLVLSLSATTVMEFTDRVFLANYSIDAISAAMPAGITSYLFLAFFGGVGTYVGVFIAQYTGRGQHMQVGTVLWQGIYFTFGSGILLVLLGFFATKPIFALAGHVPEVRILEEIYFSILCYGGLLHVASATLATFFTGRGLTRPVMLITIVGVIINIPLDYALIFGKFGLPELGIKGAALATVFSWGVSVTLLSGIIFTRMNNKRFGLFSRLGMRFNADIFTRLMRFGIPGSLQFTLDILAFTFFILLIGRIGKTELAATNIVFSINAMAYMPSMGASQGISILVGQALGKGRQVLATEYVRDCAQLLFFYILLVDLLFIFNPDLVLAPFVSMKNSGAAHALLVEQTTILLKIVTVYLFFDAMYMVYSGALRGAGDTRFMMKAIAFASPLCLILPVYLGIEYFGISVTTAWLWIVFFLLTLFMISALRYRFGAWKNMLVIEADPLPEK